MKLSELVDALASKTVAGGLEGDVTGLTDDSRQIRPGGLFVAVKGTQTDGHGFLEQVIAAGAAAVVIEAGQIPAERARALKVPVIEVPDSRRALGLLASRYYGEPSRTLRLVGITGTNGKTTTSYLAKAVLEAGGLGTGLIGTVQYVIGDSRLPAAHTTPGALELQALLRRMLDQGLTAAVMEVSSHALALDRAAGCSFGTAVFTNLTQDHLDFHADMEDYFRAKRRLFTGLAPNARAIVNLDDSYGERMRAASSASVWSYAIERRADLMAEALQVSLEGVRFRLSTPAGSAIVRSPLVGRHNVYNILATIGVGLRYGVELSSIVDAISKVTTVPGRFERVEAGQPFTVVVDYAHTDDALYRLLTTSQTVKTGRIITVFGCGGDRDRGKRPKMGRVAALFSDLTIVTSDNPRSEDPMAIIKEVEEGVREGIAEGGPGEYVVQADRRLAIERAMREARPGDLVVIAGKGHEDYQIIGKTKHPFDDRVVAREAIEKLTAS